MSASQTDPCRAVGASQSLASVSKRYHGSEPPTPDEGNASASLIEKASISTRTTDQGLDGLKRIPKRILITSHLCSLGRIRSLGLGDRLAADTTPLQAFLLSFLQGMRMYERLDIKQFTGARSVAEVTHAKGNRAMVIWLLTRPVQFYGPVFNIPCTASFLYGGRARV